MRQYRDDIPDWLQTALAVLGVICVCWFFLREGSPPPPEVLPEPVSAVTKTAKTNERSCGTALVRCTARAEVKLESAGSELCPEAKLRKRLEELLVRPLEQDDCRGAEAELRRSCPKECEPDHTAALIVPAPMSFKLAPKPNESGECVGSGEVNLALQGRCLRKIAPAAQQAE